MSVPPQTDKDTDNNDDDIEEFYPEEPTYYEILGYDTLVPNPNFAKLLNVEGELEVDSEIIKVTSEGTYVFDVAYEEEFREFYADENKSLGTPIDSIRNLINEHITLYRTFEEKPDDYSIISNGDETEYPNSYFGDSDDEDSGAEDDKPTSTTPSIGKANKPDFDSFAIFNTERTSGFGKFIQKLIGSTKSHTVKFSKKRRMRGSFYNYNYGVYAEIGVKGWTDKKNWIGWSKTPADELRVGWKNVVLHCTYPVDLRNKINNIKSFAYVPPQYTYINGRVYNVATLIIPDYTPDLKEKFINKGLSAACEYIISKNNGVPPAGLKKTDAIVIASKNDMDFIVGQEDVVKYDTKYYCHVFNKEWMEFTIGWNNHNGFFLGSGSLNQNSVSEIGPWVKNVIDLFNNKKVTLKSGEVYVCARFGDVWKGMKIIKYEKKQ